MKLYLIPIGSACNANCEFCITNFRNKKGGIIDVNLIENKLKELSNLDEIEITGGGEPLLHPKINQIIRTCSKNYPTKLYTNGAKLNHNLDLKKLSQLCISRAHYNSELNYKIMGIKYEDGVFHFHKNLKLSLMLLKNGICKHSEVIRYLDFAHDCGAKKVVIRELGKSSDLKYRKVFDRLYFPTAEIAREFGFKKSNFNPKLNYKNVEVEIEMVGCPEISGNVILGSDCKIYNEWN